MASDGLNFTAPRLHPDQPPRRADLAAAEELARHHALPLPAWTQAPERRLHRPWFASTRAALRALLPRESPAGFRPRHLFDSENVLSRA